MCKKRSPDCLRGLVWQLISESHHLLLMNPGVYEVHLSLIFSSLKVISVIFFLILFYLLYSLLNLSSLVTSLNASSMKKDLLPLIVLKRALKARLGLTCNYSLVITHCLPRHVSCWRGMPHLLYFSFLNIFILQISNWNLYNFITFFFKLKSSFKYLES